jgi:hypothetical protein
VALDAHFRTRTRWSYSALWRALSVARALTLTLRIRIAAANKHLGSFLLPWTAKRRRAQDAAPLPLPAMASGAAASDVLTSLHEAQLRNDAARVLAIMRAHDCDADVLARCCFALSKADMMLGSSLASSRSRVDAIDAVLRAMRRMARTSACSDRGWTHS